MAYTPWSVVAYEQPSVDKWNDLGENDAHFDSTITEYDAVRTLENVASAVNKFEVKNSATGSALEINAIGTDTNIDIKLSAKGTGEVLKNSYKWVTPISNISTDIEVGDGKAILKIPSAMTGMNLVSVRATVQTAGTTGTMDIQFARIRAGVTVDMLTTELTVDSGDSNSDDSTPAVVDATNDDVITDDIIRVDIDAVHTTPAQGGFVELIFRLP
jgi:hypothetical protein